jgi:hypothetical protein
LCAVEDEPEEGEDDEDGEGEADWALAMAAPPPMRTPVSVSAARALRSLDFMSRSPPLEIGVGLQSSRRAWEVLETRPRTDPESFERLNPGAVWARL